MKILALFSLFVICHLVPVNGTYYTYLQFVIRDQAPNTMTYCGSAGTANGGQGFTGTDFQLVPGTYTANEKGLVGRECNAQNGWINCGQIGSDKTPVYAYSGASPGNSVHSPSSFSSWFHNTLQNVPVTPITIALASSTGSVYSYSNTSFYPVDGRGWGDSCPVGNPPVQHNSAFCMESHSRFGYQGGETITVTSSDDFWLYINNYLVMDLGGIHAAETKTISLDTLSIGLVKSTPQVSSSYVIDMFYCQRQVADTAVFEISTTVIPYCAYYDWCGICEGSGQSCCTTQLIAEYCNDNNSCTTDTCSFQVPPSYGGCVHTPIQCSSTDVCTAASCNRTTGSCSYTAINCDDGNKCTTDSCSSPSGCKHVAISCNDNNACTADSCSVTSGCVNSPITCNDGNSCTTDSCNPSTGCVYTSIC